MGNGTISHNSGLPFSAALVYISPPPSFPQLSFTQAVGHFVLARYIKEGVQQSVRYIYEVKMNTNNLCSLSRLQKKKKNISAFEGLKQKEGKSAVAWWCGRGGFGAMEILPQHAASRRRGHQSFLWEEARGRSSTSSELPPQRPRPAREVPALPAASHGMSTR